LARKKASEKKSPVATPPGEEAGYDLVSGIAGLLEQARRSAARAVNSILSATYWEIGRRIVEFEQGGKAKADYPPLHANTFPVTCYVRLLRPSLHIDVRLCPLRKVDLEWTWCRRPVPGSSAVEPGLNARVEREDQQGLGAPVGGSRASAALAAPPEARLVDGGGEMRCDQLPPVAARPLLSGVWKG
jgi:hypothetical protein